MPPAPAAEKWLLRIPEVFSPFSHDILQSLGAASATLLGAGYHLAGFSGSPDFASAPAAHFIRWKIPLHHTWPCDPPNMEGFIEKAAQALFRKFGSLPLQTLLVGQLDPGAPNRYYKALASNLRGRTLQLFPPLPAAADAELQTPHADTLFCLVGREGLFCGVTTPATANGFHAGGSRYIQRDAGSTISRAGAKIAEALHYLRLHAPSPAPGSHWLELGASPGGMTSELLARNHLVTAIDRASLDPALLSRKNLTFHRRDVAAFTPDPAVSFHAILSDMNGDPAESMKHVVRLARHLTESGLVIFTLKTTGAKTFAEILKLGDRIAKIASDGHLRLFAKTHLTYNRQEFTFFFRKTP